MNINDLYMNELCEDEEKSVINEIVSFIKQDGFNIDYFSLTSLRDYIWEFTSNNDANRGFLLFYNPHIVNKPVPQYQLHNGCVYYSFDARNITEAYILHNKNISDKDYMLLSNVYSNTEERFVKNIKEKASQYGYEIICDLFNRTNEWLRS